MRTYLVLVSRKKLLNVIRSSSRTRSFLNESGSLSAVWYRYLKCNLQKNSWWLVRRTYTLYAKSRKIVIRGIMRAPSQKTAEEKICCSWPAMWTGERMRIDGQKRPNIRTYRNLNRWTYNWVLGHWVYHNAPLPITESQFQKVQVDVSKLILNMTVIITYV